jgi:hypothetical protein
MVNFLNCRSWTFIPLLITCIAILDWYGLADAAQLKDIRVGEYDKFTRIVFELDGPTPDPDIEIRSSGQLLVTFHKASANLIRKIPVERSPHVNNIQLWQRQERLSALLISDYPNIRIESFRLTSPPRFAVDIFPVAEQAKENMTERSGPLVPAPDESSPSAGINDQPSETGLATKQVQSTTLEHPTDSTEEATMPEESVQTTTEADSSAPLPPMAVEKVQPTMPKQRIPESTKTDSVDSQNSPPSKQNRLQLYLVVTLVIITIAILLLLLLMLLTRHRLSDEKTTLKPSQRLQNQDRKIAALNSRIRDQFKRYDEA